MSMEYPSNSYPKKMILLCYRIKNFVMKKQVNFLFALTLIALSFSIQTNASAIMVKMNGHEYSSDGGNVYGTDSTFVIDDGTGENGWFINPGYVNWLGNFFPIGTTTGGVLTSVEIFFLKNMNGENLKLSIDIISPGNVVLGSSALFTAVSGSWVPVTLSNVPFLGPFYVMVKWNNVSGITHFLGMDNNGPYAAQDLERYYDGTTFQKMSEMGVADPGVFMIRAHAVIDPAAGIEDLIAEEISIYPNPAGNYLKISSREELKSIRIADLSGKVLADLPGGDAKEMQLDITGIVNGFYCVILTTKEGGCARKISVIH
jgi:hypothetical protein